MSIVLGIITMSIGGWLCSSGGAFDIMAGIMLVLVGACFTALGAEHAALSGQLKTAIKMLAEKESK